MTATTTRRRRRTGLGRGRRPPSTGEHGAAGGDTARRRRRTSAAAAPAAATDGATLTIGYSAWPGWFPLAVAEEEGIFEEAGLDVELTYFVDYTASLDALVGRQHRRQHPDAERHDLRRRRRQPSRGSSSSTTTRPATTPSSATRRSRRSRTSKGKTIAAEAGVVDHFLLLQGLAKEGLTEDDIEFQGVKTDAAAAAFAGGQFDCVGVFAPFTVAGARAGGLDTCCSARRTSPARSPTTSWPPPTPPTSHADDAAEAGRRLVPHARLDRGQPRRGDGDHGRQGRGVAARTTTSFAEGTTIFDADQALDAVRRPARRPDVAAGDGPPHQPVPRRVRADRAGGRPRPACSTPDFTAGVRREQRRLSRRPSR